MSDSAALKNGTICAESTTSTAKSKKNKELKNQVAEEIKEGGPSYTAMIAQAILSNHLRRATLSEIYEFMANKFDVLKKRGTGWRNCVRHTLSLNECFVKLHRPENGRSCNWAVHPNYFESFLQGDYRKRRMLRKKGMPVPWLESEALNYAASISYLRESNSHNGEQEHIKSFIAEHNSQLWPPYQQSYPYEPSRACSSLPPSLVHSTLSSESARQTTSASPTTQSLSITQGISPHSSLCSTTPYCFSDSSSGQLPDYAHLPSTEGQSYPLSIVTGHHTVHTEIPAYSEMLPVKSLSLGHNLTALPLDKPAQTYTSSLLADSSRISSYPVAMQTNSKTASYSNDSNEHVHTCHAFGADSNCFACYLSKPVYGAARSDYFPGL